MKITLTKFTTRMFLTNVFFIFTVLVSACSNLNRDPLIGKWQEIGGKATPEYFSDGTFIASGKDIPVNGKWKRLDDGRIKIEAIVFGITMGEILTVTIEEDTATFTDSKGKVEKFERIK